MIGSRAGRSRRTWDLVGGREGERGSVAVEFAAGMMFLALLITGVMEMSINLSHMQAVVQAARRGAGAGATAPEQHAAVGQAAAEELLAQQGLTGYQVSSVLDATGAQLTVEASIPYASFFPFYRPPQGTRLRHAVVLPIDED